MAGIRHPFVSPDQMLAMLALAIGLSASPGQRPIWCLAAFLAASVVGLFLSALPPWVIYALSGMGFAMAAAIPGQLSQAWGGLAVLTGLAIGHGSIVEIGPVVDRALTMGGAIIGAGLGVTYGYVLFDWARRRSPWPVLSLAFRVAAAWGAAVALIMLALQASAPLH